MIPLTGIKNTKNTCSNIICQKYAYHIGMLLGGILDKRNINETLKKIEGNILEN